MKVMFIAVFDRRVYPDVLFWPVLEYCRYVATVVNGDEQTPETQKTETLKKRYNRTYIVCCPHFLGCKSCLTLMRQKSVE